MILKKIVAFAIFSFSALAFSQINFEKGYFINNSDERISCYIKNEAWRNNPNEFTYKTSLEDKRTTVKLEGIKEFGVDNDFKYQRYTVNIDRSKKSLNDLSKSQEPVFSKEQIFLKVLVEGKASLFSYQDGNLIGYFFSKDDSDVTQLIYKTYKIDQFKTAKNTKYKMQLWENLRCGVDKYAFLNRVEYRKGDLIKYFVNYNTCSDASFINYDANKNGNAVFKISLRPGLNSSSLEYSRVGGQGLEVKHDTQISARFGVEFEYVLGFNKNKWSVILEPTYQSYNDVIDDNRQVDYKSIEIPMGIRHYMFLSKSTKFFANAQVILDFPNNSILQYSRLQSLKLSSKPNLVFGVGFKYDDKYSLELRGQTRRNVLNGFPGWNSYYRTVSLILGYTIL